jgi:hypothetical protein
MNELINIKEGEVSRLREENEKMKLKIQKLAKALDSAL